MTALLNDDDYLRFLTQGYVIVEPASLGLADHEYLWDRADALYERTRKLESPTAHLEILGDNLRAQIPEIDRVLLDPAVTGAVSSIVGEDAFLHPHQFVHESSARDQPFHQDGNLPWNERGHYRAHRPDWLLLFYYPQAVTLDNGPTEIVPGSQYWTTDIEREDGSWRPGDFIDETTDRSLLGADDLALRDQMLAASVEQLNIPNLERRFIEVPRGSVVLANYDLIHRGSRRRDLDGPGRYLFKFHFARTREPVGPSWENQLQDPPLDGMRDDLEPIIQSVWAWSRGQRCRRHLDRASVEESAQTLSTAGENDKVAAAYRLGSDDGQASLAALLEALYDAQESTRRAAAYGLRLRCDEAGEALGEAARSERVSVRRFAVFALGAAWSPGADLLIERLAGENDDLARSNAAYALGQVARNTTADSRSIVRALIERLRPGVEPDNTSVAGLSRSTVRQSAAHAIVQLAFNHVLDADAREDLARLACVETDRYVAGMLFEVLARESADAALIRDLAARRWNPVPRDSSVRSLWG